MIRLPGERGTSSRLKLWRSALLYAVPIAALIMGLFYYWFAVADRYIVFLYQHDMGPLVPDTSPFSRVTSSRYWMAGLVASGEVAILYGFVNWLLGRIMPKYRVPEWWRVWAICAALSLVGIPGITMTVNQPTLPASNAAQVTAITLLGLVLALLPGRLAAECPGKLIWLGADGFGLSLVLLNLIHLEELSRWLARGAVWWVRMMAVSLAAGVGWLLIVTGLGFWRRQSGPGAMGVFVAGLYVAYLLMPVVHHLIGTDGYYYISDSDNFFAKSEELQAFTWIVAAGIALGLAWLRRRLATLRARA